MMAPLDEVPTEHGDLYVAGACNIGSAEAATRRMLGISAACVTLVLGIALLALGAPPAWLLLTAVPASATAIGLLQARSRFCVGYAVAGMSNFGDSRADAVTSTDSAERAADRVRARQLTRRSMALGLLTGALFVVLAAIL